MFATTVRGATPAELNIIVTFGAFTLMCVLAYAIYLAATRRRMKNHALQANTPRRSSREKRSRKRRK